MKNKDIKWLVVPLIYLVICIWTYFTASVEIQGVVLPQHEAGMWGLIALHVMGLLAVVGAYALHWLVEGLTWIYNKLFN